MLDILNKDPALAGRKKKSTGKKKARGEKDRPSGGDNDEHERKEDRPMWTVSQRGRRIRAPVIWPSATESSDEGEDDQSSASLYEPDT